MRCGDTGRFCILARRVDTTRTDRDGVGGAAWLRLQRTIGHGRGVFAASVRKADGQPQRHSQAFISVSLEAFVELNVSALPSDVTISSSFNFFL